MCEQGHIVEDKIFSPTMSEDQQISQRPRSHPYQEYIQRQRNLENAAKVEVPGGRKLWRQMVTGFICAACLGFIMLLLGSIFIGQAIKGENSITIMLCVMGMVCGMIILVGTGILGRLFISRKWRVQQGREPVNHPEACFHTCSIIYTPSQDQLNNPQFVDPPPAYEMIIYSQQRRTSSEDNLPGSVEVNTETGTIVQPVMLAPPKYSVAAAPIPSYGEPV